MATVIKNVIAPIQAWLLSQGRCVGCGLDLSSGKVKGNQVTCSKCGRVYIKDSKTSKYRRALLSEIIK